MNRPNHTPEHQVRRRRGFAPLSLGIVATLLLSLPIMSQAARSLGSAYQYDVQQAEALALASSATLTASEMQTTLALINSARAVARTCGTKTYPAVPAVTWNTRLQSAAQRHSIDMANHNFFSHTGSDGSTPASRITAAGYVWSYLGENIAAGYATPNAVVAGWLKSAGHCANIMNGRVKHLGVAKATNAGSRYGVYWTLDLAAPR